MSTMTAEALRYVIETRVGEKTGAVVYVVSDTLTGRVPKFYTLDVTEAGELAAAYNEGRFADVERILNCEPVPARKIYT
jgi:hypothetical protein